MMLEQRNYRHCRNREKSGLQVVANSLLPLYCSLYAESRTLGPRLRLGPRVRLPRSRKPVSRKPVVTLLGAAAAGTRDAVTVTVTGVTGGATDSNGSLVAVPGTVVRLGLGG